jgi:hypothetical protein
MKRRRMLAFLQTFPPMLSGRRWLDEVRVPNLTTNIFLHNPLSKPLPVTPFPRTPLVIHPVEMTFHQSNLD